MIRVEFFDVARQRAGVAVVEVPAGSLVDVLRAVAARVPSLVPEVIQDGRLDPYFRASRDGREFIGADAVLRDGESLLLLSALAGG